MNFFRLLILSFVLLAGHIPRAQAQQGIPALFNFQSGGSACRVYSIGPAPSSPTIERERVVLEKALVWFGKAISSAKADTQSARAVAHELQALAEARAFTRLDWSGSGSSPAHWQTNLLKNIAMAVNVIDHRGGWSGEQREVVVAWGNEVYRSTHYTAWNRSQSDRWPDTMATAAAAYTLWGIAAPNAKALSEGQSDFKKVARLLRPTGGTGSYYGGGKYASDLPDGWGARIEDKLLGDLVLTAYAAGRIGRDLFNVKFGKVSLYEGIIGWQSTLFADHGAAVRGEDLSFFNREGGERSWAWTEYFVANFSNDPASAALREESARIRGSGYVSQSMGPATCLLR